MSARKDLKQPAIDTTAAQLQVAKQVQAWRLARHQSKRNLARLSGFPISALTRLEKGASNPSLSTLVRLAHGLDIPLHSLLFKKPPKSYAR